LYTGKHLKEPSPCHNEIKIQYPSPIKIISMERYNIFYLIHKGLRASLYETALQLQQNDFNSANETELVLNKIKEVIMLFEGHAAKEDRFIFSAINSYEPSVVATFEDEHETNAQLGQELYRGIEAVNNAKSLLEKIVCGRKLTESFVHFMVFNLQHMYKEESIINKILWRYYSDEEIRSIGGQINQATPPWIQEFYSTWVLRGINNREAISWIKAIGKGMSPLVFQTLLQKAEQEWPAKRFQEVSKSLTEGMQLA
jgi:hemerythrin-like domain-containing protein